ncbi:Thioredoxin-dependent peroxiredoxin [Ascochyta rabiei]|uniref:Thioredoxin-dependent peroxiredoxin n=1 Tax=Didymella rabiei TaxID=5454 RepID=UPI0021FE0A3A|nr:Thioredoxin-dependent peroxiredoxin [Ascochyta rabiei]UPX21127.1 Thioredoxin-dependent peroxiredoxin [Ascochyta rabiei]
MSYLGEVRIGHKAPDFHCEAVIGGAIKEVSLSTFIRPSTVPGAPDPDAPWLLLLFIPAAFSFVCPTEVIAFQNCYDEFRDRNCSVAFVSVDTKHSLWHWQNVPRQYGGLGNIDIPLLSDATHKIGRDYGVLIEEEGVSLRGMFIVDGEGLVQQITLNNLTVGRSVLEALRLLEAFQAVAKHGVLCPIDWKPNSHASDTMNTISNTLVESYEDRLANLQKEFGDVKITDLDAKHKSTDNMENVPHAEYVNTPGVHIVSSPESLDRVREENSETRYPPSSPGHPSCILRVGPTEPGELSVSESLEQTENL